MSATAGTVTIVLPTYNRAAFLPAAFESIRQQSFDDWSIVVVDDGSTDSTHEVVQSCLAQLGDRVRYVHQDNRGAYAARNRGLDEADGKYIAFFDSDDLWLPHHLQRCVTALESNPDVDWVWGASEIVDYADGRTVEPNNFLVDGHPRPFVRLRTRRSGDLHIIEDPEIVACHIFYGLYCGLQNSVMKRSLFDRRRFNAASKVMDDQFFVTRVLADGAKFGYFLEPHVIYRLHDQNSSASSSIQTSSKQVRIATEAIEGLEQLMNEIPLTRRSRRALLKRLGHEYFWHLGYACYWQGGRRREALAMFKRGLAHWPWNLAGWKTYALAELRTRFRLKASAV